MSRRTLSRSLRDPDLAMDSQVDSDFEVCMAILKTLMGTIGLWPLDDGVGVWSICKALTLILTMLFLNILPQTTKAIKSRDNFALMLEVITKVDMNEILCFIKIVTLWRRRLEMKALVVQVREDWTTANTEERRKMRFYTRVSKWILRSMIFTVFGSITIYNVQYIVNFKANTVWVNGTPYRPELFFSYFPFATHESPIFEIINVGQWLSTSLSAFDFVAYDGIYVISILHFNGQLYNLKRRVQNLVKEHRVMEVSFTKCIKSIIERQLHLVSHTDMLESSYNKTFLVQVFALSVFLCLQGYQFIKLMSDMELEPVLLIFTIFFIMANLITIFIYCAIAQVIRDESLSLFDAIYQMQWYELPPMIVIVMGRCAKPIEFTVGKFTPLTREYFARFIKSIGGYMSVLLAVRDKIM